MRRFFRLYGPPHWLIRLGGWWDLQDRVTDLERRIIELERRAHPSTTPRTEMGMKWRGME